jgi:hypothetical protein
MVEVTLCDGERVTGKTPFRGDYIIANRFMDCEEAVIWRTAS